MFSKPGYPLIALWVGLGLAACPTGVGAQVPIDPPFLVRDLRTSETNRSSDPRGLVVMGDRAYFLATDEFHGRELWRTDGTEAGTRHRAGSRPGPWDLGILNRSRKSRDSRASPCLSPQGGRG